MNGTVLPDLVTLQIINKENILNEFVFPHGLVYGP